MQAQSTRTRGRKPTEAQRAAAEERRAAFRELAQRVGALSDEERAQVAARMGGVVTVDGRALSVLNTCLVAFQRDDATIVGGFRQWLAAGRAVRKGERGLAIWAPSGRKEESDDEGEDTRPGFVMVTVFDVSQTDPREEVAA